VDVWRGEWQEERGRRGGREMGRWSRRDSMLCKLTRFPHNPYIWHNHRYIL